MTCLPRIDPSSWNSLSLLHTNADYLVPYRESEERIDSGSLYGIYGLIQKVVVAATMSRRVVSPVSPYFNPAFEQEWLCFNPMSSGQSIMPTNSLATHYTQIGATAEPIVNFDHPELAGSGFTNDG